MKDKSSADESLERIGFDLRMMRIKISSMSSDSFYYCLCKNCDVRETRCSFNPQLRVLASPIHVLKYLHNHLSRIYYQVSKAGKLVLYDLPEIEMDNASVLNAYTCWKGQPESKRFFV